MTTTRYGNKSVISEVRDDDMMPHTADGRRVDLILNLLAIINRTTSMPLYEIAINAINYQVRQKMLSMETYQERANLLFDVMKEWNEIEYERMLKLYMDKDKKGKEEFIDDVLADRIYVHEPPLWETKPLFYRIMDVLKKYPWLEPSKMTVYKWGRQRPILAKMWIGEMYILKLKQSDRRGFSVRSTGAIDARDLPTRNYKSRSHLEQYSGTAIRFGEFETLDKIRGVA